MVLGHQMIPHHHHDVHANDFSIHHSHGAAHTHGADGHHHPEAGDHHPASHNHQEKGDDFAFPFHEHLSVTHGFDLLRQNGTTRFNPVEKIRPVDFVVFYLTIPLQPPETQQVFFTDLPFNTFQSHQPAVNFLRGPPRLV